MKFFSQETNFQVPLSGGSSIPTSGYYTQGNYYQNTSPNIQGSAGSKYVIKGWIRVTTGNTHVLNTDWVADKVLTGS